MKHKTNKSNKWLRVSGVSIKKKKTVDCREENACEFYNDDDDDEYRFKAEVAFNHSINGEDILLTADRLLKSR